jgi:hypothetical protein
MSLRNKISVDSCLPAAAGLPAGRCVSFVNIRVGIYSQKST